MKAWVYAVLNPVIDSLRREAGFLKTGNLSWRAHRDRCEYIQPIYELVDASHEPILEDLLAEDSTLRQRFDDHDSALARVERAAADFFQNLIGGDSFRLQVAESLKEYESLRASNSTLPELSGIQSKVPEYVAEFIVNNAKSLPRHHTMYSFWDRFEPEFLSFKQRPTFAVAMEAAENLLRISEKLRLDLETLRLNLVREYDIPAAPFGPQRSAPAGNVFG